MKESWDHKPMMHLHDFVGKWNKSRIKKFAVQVHVYYIAPLYALLGM